MAHKGPVAVGRPRLPNDAAVIIRKLKTLDGNKPGRIVIGFFTGGARIGRTSSGARFFISPVK